RARLPASPRCTAICRGRRGGGPPGGGLPAPAAAEGHGGARRGPLGDEGLAAGGHGGADGRRQGRGLRAGPRRGAAATRRLGRPGRAPRRSRRGLAADSHRLLPARSAAGAARLRGRLGAGARPGARRQRPRLGEPPSFYVRVVLRSPTSGPATAQEDRNMLALQRIQSQQKDLERLRVLADAQQATVKGLQEQAATCRASQAADKQQLLEDKLRTTERHALDLARRLGAAGDASGQAFELQCHLRAMADKVQQREQAIEKTRALRERQDASLARRRESLALALEDARGHQAEREEARASRAPRAEGRGPGGSAVAANGAFAYLPRCPTQPPCPGVTLCLRVRIGVFASGLLVGVLAIQTAGGVARASEHRAPDCKRQQMPMECPTDPHCFTWHRRAPLHCIEGSRWTNLTPDYDVVALDLSQGRHRVLDRRQPSPGYIANQCHAFDPVDNFELHNLQREARQ
ncbi:unnamed protein product, partial [Prorocentrum cordatum]